jgi:hypothetical protein
MGHIGCNGINLYFQNLFGAKIYWHIAIMKRGSCDRYFSPSTKKLHTKLRKHSMKNVEMNIGFLLDKRNQFSILKRKYSR